MEDIQIPLLEESTPTFLPSNHIVKGDDGPYIPFTNVSGDLSSQGFWMKLMINSEQCFGKHTFELIATIADRKIESPEEVTSSLHFKHSRVGGAELSKLDLLFALLLECRIHEWVEGVGFVDCPSVRGVLPPEKIQVSKGDPNARAALLVQGVSSSHVPPLLGMYIEVSAVMKPEI